MLSLGPLAFATPWILAALAVLPVLWWLLRVTPPAPRVQEFPAIRLLRDLVAREETPARTPLWLLLLRLVLAALVILALARPLLNPDAALPGGGPLLLVVDNGWAAGRDWPARQDLMERLIAQAERAGRPVVLLATAPSPTAEPPHLVGPSAAADARRDVQALTPSPWPVDRMAALAALDRLPTERAPYTVWLSDGVADAGAEALATRLRRLGGLEVVGDGPDRPALLLRPPTAEGLDLVVPVERSDSALPQTATIRAVATDGRLLGAADVRFTAGAARAEARLNLPTELRNEAAALRLDGQNTAGATLLLDEGVRRRPVGLVSGRGEGEEQPLLSDLHYLDRALSPFAEIRRGDIGSLLQRELSVLILADVGSLSGGEAEQLDAWVRKGGVLLRFAGPRLARNADTLTPVRLRSGDRALGGALSWSVPARLAPFPETSPFHGLTVPEDVTVSRQVLAEPSLELPDRTWARLEDGTPLVTAEKRGNGFTVLVHTTAGPDWSNLSLSGLFVEMLRRVVALSAGVATAEGAGTLAPLELLDGQGRLVAPGVTAFPLPAERLARAPAELLGPRHPPGFYGIPEARRALNLAPAVATLQPLEPLLSGMARGLYGVRGEVDLKPLLLTAALMLLVADLFIGLALRGLLRGARAGRGIAALAALLLLTLPPSAKAQERPLDVDKAIQATAQTWLAYVVTGDAAVDAVSKAGLEGLSYELGQRTAAETAGAMAVDVDADELSFYPLIYWPVTPAQPPLSDRAREKLTAYLRQGGMLLIDTRDQGVTGGRGPGGPQLEALLSGLDIPPLAPITPEHVLTKSFYLLQDFPGRYAGGEVWAEAQSGSVNDGVSGVIIGAADWAGAWAVDGQGRPMYAVVPGPERQREMAYRFGINLVMYALTGNYKADQVHVPAILERLGQ